MPHHIWRRGLVAEPPTNRPEYWCRGRIGVVRKPVSPYVMIYAYRCFRLRLLVRDRDREIMRQKAEIWKKKRETWDMLERLEELQGERIVLEAKNREIERKMEKEERFMALLRELGMPPPPGGIESLRRDSDEASDYDEFGYSGESSDEEEEEEEEEE